VRPDRLRGGSALLDVVIALVVLGLSGVALITLLGQTAHSMRVVRNSERLTRRASDELSRLVIYDRVQLTELAGRSLSHGWWLDVGQFAPGLFDVAISETDSTPPVLRTTFYRPDTTHEHTP
jgi:hypothetical protein